MSVELGDLVKVLKSGKVRRLKKYEKPHGVISFGYVLDDNDKINSLSRVLIIKGEVSL